MGVTDAQVPQSTAAPTRDSLEPGDRLATPAPTGLPHTSPEQRSRIAAPILLRGLKDRTHPTECPWTRLEHPDGGALSERGTCFAWNPQGFTLGWYVEPRWGVSNGLMRPSGSVFLRFLDSLLDRCGSFVREERCAY